MSVIRVEGLKMASLREGSAGESQKRAKKLRPLSLAKVWHNYGLSTSASRLPSAPNFSTKMIKLVVEGEQLVVAGGHSSKNQICMVSLTTAPILLPLFSL
jgi:hypothetical protein